MGNEYDHHSINHHYLHQKAVFLPLFCRLSIKDIKLNNRHKDPNPAADEPSSPKVSCMGQVKRNNRVIGFPPAAAAAVATHHHRYSKLKKLFSSKTLLPPTSSSIPNTTPGGDGARGGRSGSRSCRSSREMCVNNSRRLRVKDDKRERDCVKAVTNISELDPPLPVVKKVAPPGIGRDQVNLWKRRFNGTEALKSLQIERIQLPKSTNSLPPTV